MTGADETIPLDAARRERRNFMPNEAFVAPRLSGLDLATLAGMVPPERDWLVPAWLPAKNVTLLTGDGGLGKSLLGLQLMVSTATGRPWLGQPVPRGRAVGIFCEDDEGELWRRLDDVSRAAGVGLADLAEDLVVVPRVGQDNSLMGWERWEGTPGKPTDLFQSIFNLASNTGASLVVLDSLHDLFPGNENSRVHARQFIGLLRQLALDCECTVLLLAHPSAAGLSTGSGTSGSTAWNNAVRSRLYLTRPAADGDGADDDGERILARRKANYAPAGETLRLQWRDGAFIAPDNAGGMVETIVRRSAERVFLDLLDATERANRPVSASPNAGNFAPKQFARSPHRRGYGRADLARAMEALFAAGTITQANYGRTGDQRTKIVRVVTPGEVAA